jgi:AcrR family transcriptional regulator
MLENTEDLWLQKGLQLLDKSGKNSLKISILCEELNLTKGSFYHWFKSKQYFDQSLLKYWRQLFTRQFIEDANLGGSSQEKLSRLIEKCINGMGNESRLELEINIWGHQDKDIGVFVETVYKERFQYLITLLEDIYKCKEEANRHGQILYCLMIGVELFYQKLSRNDLRSIFKEYL